MDVEREIERIEIEASVENNFDDLNIYSKNRTTYCQIKDFENVRLDDLKFSKNAVKIKGKKHKLSDDINLLFFKNIDIDSNCQIYGLNAFKTSNTYIISLSRVEAQSIIKEKYENNERRESVINSFYSNRLDNRELNILRDELPIIDVFDTELLEETINVGRQRLKFSNILLIEGKPGVGKSHYVNSLVDEFDRNVVYRFWVSNQDKEYQTRLVCENFLTDISKKLFNDYKKRTANQIIKKIVAEKKVFILDGLDHVENYNPVDLDKYVQFITKLGVKAKVVVLSRPLKIKLKWNKQILTNWNERETQKVLNDLYHITEYQIKREIYEITNGYPLLVRFISKHYKAFGKIPSLNKLKGIDDYYDQVITNVNAKSALSLFIVSRSFYMKSELNLFLDDELSALVEELIASCPYLFEIRLNRVSLFHDSFNKYLCNQNIDFTKRRKVTSEIVYCSIMKGETRFLSRFTYFDLSIESRLAIIRKYISIKFFEKVINSTVDHEAIRSFYFQIRESLNDISQEDLNIINYYDLSLIINMIGRDHVSGINEFFYTYAKCLIFNKYSIENITSSEYLFAMFYYIINKDSSLLYNVTSNNNYDTSHFLQRLERDVKSENYFFQRHEKPIKLVKELDFYFREDGRTENLKHILINLYVHKTTDDSLIELQNCVDTFMDKSQSLGISLLDEITGRYNWQSVFSIWVLNDVKKTILSLGKIPKVNEYLNLTLKDYIIKNSYKGSFEMWSGILGYLRLSLHLKKKIDIESIGLFWPMYNMRKDYSVINIGSAFKVFEECNLMNEKESIEKIAFIQSMSEKGIRHIFNDYILLHTPKVIHKIMEHKAPEELEISWLDLPSQYINILPNRIFNQASKSLIKYNVRSREIKFEEIVNIYHSNRWMMFQEGLKLFRFAIIMSGNEKEFDDLKDSGFFIKIESSSKKKVSVSDKNYRFNNGILTASDKNYIIEKGLTLLEVAGYTNGNHSSLAELEIFDVFDKNEIKSNLSSIIYNAILGKINSINMYGSLYYLVGNIPRLVKDYDNEQSLIEMYDSFNTFLKLSLLNGGGEVA